MWTPTLGAAYAFEPNMLKFNIPAPGRKSRKKDDKPNETITGRITYINEAHRYFLVTAELDHMVIKESFKF